MEGLRVPEPVVLVVDDHEDIRRLLTHGLTNGGFRVCEAASAEVALNTLEGESVAAVITDVELGTAPDGLGLVRLLHDRFPQMPCFVVTGGRTTEAEALATGAKRLFKKPFRLRDIVESVESSLGY